MLKYILSLLLLLSVNVAFAADPTELVKVPEPQAKASPLDGVWVVTYMGRNYLRVFRGGVMAGTHGERVKFTVKGNKVFMGNDIIEFNPDTPDHMDGINKAGHRFTYNRFNW